MKLKGHRLEQLQMLDTRGAVSRETAVCTSLGREFRPGTLSRMISEGFVAQAYLAFGGDPKRRLAHYWLLPAGRAALLPKD